MKSKNKEKSITEEKKNDKLEFSVAFRKDGESFQSIMEKILMSKLTRNT